MRVVTLWNFLYGRASSHSIEGTPTAGQVEIHDGPYNINKNWDYPRFAESLQNGNGELYTCRVRLCSAGRILLISSADKDECLVPACLCSSLRLPLQQFEHVAGIQCPRPCMLTSLKELG